MHRPEMGRELSSVGIAVGIADEWDIGWAVDFEVGTEYCLAEGFPVGGFIVDMPVGIADGLMVSHDRECHR